LSQTNPKKVLLWLDHSAYAYQNFAIGVSLSNLENYDFYGIVAQKKDYEFFNQQTKLKFKKLWYYPECYINKNNNSDLSFLSSLEKKYGLKLWLLAYSERMFYEYREHFYQFSHDEILSIIESIAKYFIEILEKVKPKIIIMQIVGENIANSLLYHLANHLGIKTVMLLTARLHNTFFLSESMFGKDFHIEYFKNKQHLDDISQDPMELLYLKNPSETVKLASSFVFDDTTLFEKVMRNLKKIKSDPEPLYHNRGKSNLKMLKWKVKMFFEVKKRKNFLDKKALKVIPNENFIYFPLQAQPEATTLAHAPYFSDQLALIKNISKSLPIDYFLYVKEHPIQSTKFWRPIEYYKEIIDMPNVKLFHPFLDSKELISKCSLVAVITGTPGFEALFYKKPVLLFSNTFYDCVSMVHKFINFSELPSQIKNILESPTFKINEFNALIQTIKKTSFTINYIQIMKDALLLSSIRRKSSIQETELQFDNFFQTHKNDLLTIAEAYRTKLL